jgi:hypothetical protein
MLFDGRRILTDQHRFHRLDNCATGLRREAGLAIAGQARIRLNLYEAAIACIVEAQGLDVALLGSCNIRA